MIRVRFAPSPTGALHIGGARTALFNWVYARAQSGRFVLRIEDTDRKRSRPEFVEEILESLRWLGLDWDELHRQSERFDLYRREALRLVDSGRAYREGEAVLLKMPEGAVTVHDIIRGPIVFETETLKDQVLLKSDGSPAYNFACVVDDARMEISHVIRGEDHIPNTPKQLVIYRALGVRPPKYAHLPLILDAEGGRMSKRHGAVAVSAYRKEGYLPGAVVNHLMLLGWSPGGDQEIFSLDAAVKKFSLKKVNKTAAVFSLEKLRWLNGQYFKRMPPEEALEFLGPFLSEAAIPWKKYDRQWLLRVVNLYQGRMTLPEEFLQRTAYLFRERVGIPADLRARYVEGRSELLGALIRRLETTSPFDVATVESAFRAVVAEAGIPAGDLVHPVRVLLSGSDVGIGLFDMMALLGRERTLQRLREGSDAYG